MTAKCSFLFVPFRHTISARNLNLGVLGSSPQTILLSAQSSILFINSLMVYLFGLPVAIRFRKLEAISMITIIRMSGSTSGATITDKIILIIGNVYD